MRKVKEEGGGGEGVIGRREREVREEGESEEWG